MAYRINDGMVEQDGVLLEAEQLFSLGRISAHLDNDEVELIMSKRPTRIHFEFKAEPAPHFLLFFRGSH